MKSEFIDLDFYYWWAEGRYRGHFQLDWIFIKDINFKKILGYYSSNFRRSTT